MAFIETPQVTIEDLINYLNQFPKDAIVCTHNSHAWNFGQVKPINKSDMEYYIQKVDNPTDASGESVDKVCVSIYDFRRVDY